MSKAFKYVRCTPTTPGVEEKLVCEQCDGEGLLLADAKSNDEIIFCEECNGMGGTDANAVSRAREFSEAYKRALLDR